MWVFAHHFPKDAWILAPRGLYQSPDSGYGWTETRSGLLATIQDFLPAVEHVSEWVKAWVNQELPSAKLTLIGFSQGAALSYCIGLINPQMIDSIAGLAGFLPIGSDAYAQYRPLNNTPVFVAHGTRDETVPINRARQAVLILKDAGAKVTYCESDVGHKLGANCLHSLDEFVTRADETSL
jgi:phospholipase/carboxylesterase